MMRLSILFLFISLQLNVFAQQQLSTKSKAAIKLYQSGVSELSLRSYPEAIESFEKAIEKDAGFVEAYLMLGEVYFEQQKPNEAIVYFTKAMELNPEIHPFGYLTLGKLNFETGNYKEAKLNFEKFLNTDNEKEKLINESKEYIEKCEFSINAIANPVPFNPTNMGDKINTEYDEYWPSLSADEQMLVFTVLLPKDRNNPKIFGNRQEDFYYTAQKDGEWEQAKSVGAPLNTLDNEGAQTITADGKWMFFTACNRDDGKGQCDIYFSQRKGNSWSIPVNIGAPVNTGSKEKQPSVSPDGRTLYFSSDRGGGFGGMDIWVSQLTDAGTWSQPKNLGERINTKDDEISPFIHPDNQTLYFSSKEHMSLGGFDIFMSKKDSLGIWREPQNLGYPINTHLDEIGLITNSMGNHAYYSSSREPEKGRDLFEFELYPDARPTPVSYMKGKVYDADTKQKLKAKFELIDLKSGNTVSESFSDDSDGEFLICIPTNHDYALNINKKGYLFYSENFTLKGIYEQINPFLVDIPLNPIKVGKKIVLKNIFYETNSFDLKSVSKVELDRTVELLKNNPSVTVEISGHTDNVGSEFYNNELSENRAKSVYNYLKENGIEENRMIYKGYGMSQPIESNDNEEGRAKNRRTELKVTGT